MKDSLMAIMADLDEVFCFNREATYQDRAHDYLVRHDVGRSVGDTAVQCVVRHLLRRAVNVARADPELKGRMIEEATRLLQLARDMEG